MNKVKTVVAFIIGVLITVFVFRDRIDKEAELLAKIDILSGRRPL